MLVNKWHNILLQYAYSIGTYFVDVYVCISVYMNLLNLCVDHLCIYINQNK